MVGVKHEHAPAGSDGSLTRREQRAMLFSSENEYTRTHKYMYIYLFIYS
jgi:hypothetical protein